MCEIVYSISDKYSNEYFKNTKINLFTGKYSKRYHFLQSFG